MGTEKCWEGPAGAGKALTLLFSFVWGPGEEIPQPQKPRQLFCWVRPACSPGSPPSRTLKTKGEEAEALGRQESKDGPTPTRGLLL